MIFISVKGFGKSMLSDFYDKLAIKFGGYKTGHRHVSEYPNGDPEKIFKDKLIKLSGGNIKVLDIGCADGRFTLSVAPNFKKITAIDLSTGMLKSAKKLQKKLYVKNVSFEKHDAFHTPYKKDSFDLIYNRRGPTPLAEVFRLLKTEGHYVEIDIGEKDCMGLKIVFGRGQNYGEWNKRRINLVKKEAGKIGFKSVYLNEFIYDEFYLSYGDLDLFLQGVPIFEDFDSRQDKKLLNRYALKYQTGKGIRLDRHRVVSVFKKPMI